MDHGLGDAKVSTSLPNALWELTRADECSTANHRFIQPRQDLNLAQPDTLGRYTRLPVSSLFTRDCQFPGRQDAQSMKQPIQSHALTCIENNITLPMRSVIVCVWKLFGNISTFIATKYVYIFYLKMLLRYL